MRVLTMLAERPRDVNVTAVLVLSRALGHAVAARRLAATLDGAVPAPPGVESER
jgi:hypothetical protein